ncbi:MAG: LamG domain-containing protein, partial [Alphaproteobacteria bacterium]|nr:LamG domain-containing protein [Alphaproteobacteria bacterium]
MLKITGYPDRYSAAPGDRIGFKVSLHEGSSFEARLVRVIHGDANPQGPGLKFRHVPCAAEGRYPGRVQPIDAGSWMEVPGFPALTEPFTFHAMIWPTLVRRDDQTIVSQWDPASGTGWHVGLAAGGFVSVSLGGAEGSATHVASRAMVQRQWYSLTVHIDPATGLIRISQMPLVPYAMSDDRLDETAALRPAAGGPGLWLAGAPAPEGIGRHFDGKIDSPVMIAGENPPSAYERILNRPVDPELSARMIAHWDFSRGIDTPIAVDIGPFGR